ncbi:MAG: hypothetical protein JKY42_07435 [Flavobacteriales bacterium]|nr:hypothetical protein [Flavobacteriales bacterium]
MKLKHLTIIVLSVSIGIVALTYESVEAKSAGAPPSRAGAPTIFAAAESTCNSSGCHNSYTTNSGPGELTVELLNGWAGYTPGVPREITVRITQPGFSNSVLKR